MVDADDLGVIRHFRGCYLQDLGAGPTLDTWRFHSAGAGSGRSATLGVRDRPCAVPRRGEAPVAAVATTFVPDRNGDRTEDPSLNRETLRGSQRMICARVAARRRRRIRMVVRL